MPRNRTVRLAVLGSSVQRAAAAKYPSRARTALTRRVVAGVLVLLALVMITLSFRAREDGGGLDNLQGPAATALRPFQVGIERVVRPFRDLYRSAQGLVDAKSEADRLRSELREARQLADQYQLEAQQYAELRKLVHLRAPPAYPGEYDGIPAVVVGYPAAPFVHKLTIAAGWADDVRVNDPVVNGDGLVGLVTKTSGHTAEVTLLTDEEVKASALDVQARTTGIVSRSGGDMLVLDLIPKTKRVRKGDEVVTAGSTRGEPLGSLYPRGIPIGEVAFVGQNDVDPFKTIHVEPYVDFDSIDSVMVLVPKHARR